MQPLSGTCSDLMLMVDGLGDSAMMQVGRQMAEKAMATVPVNDYEDALNSLSTDQRFRATAYAMNKLLVQKGIYSPAEFRFQFRQWAQKHPQFMRALGHYLSSLVA